MVHSDVKKCADQGDIKGLRYIFVDCLDVDPTFEKYEEDFSYCRNIPGLFESHLELMPFAFDKMKWNDDYWKKLKTDLIKNFSQERFEHMRTVAVVVYAEKVKRIELERAAYSKLEKDKRETEKSAHADMYIRKSDVSSNSAVRVSQKAEQERKIEEEKRRLREENERIEAEYRKQMDALHADEKKEGKERSTSEGAAAKKLMGAVVLIIAILIIIMLIIK